MVGRLQMLGVFSKPNKKIGILSANPRHFERLNAFS